MKTSIPFENDQFHKLTVVDSELDLLKAIYQFFDCLGASGATETISNLITEYAIPKSERDDDEFTREHLSRMVSHATMITSFLVKIDTLYDRYIHFHPERAEELKNHKLY